MPKMVAIAEELDKRAGSRPIGGLQELRKELKGLARLPTHHIFSSQTTFKEYAFHVGGRTELQFNIGFDSPDDEEMFRDGVAFSLEPSQSLPDIDVLVPKIKRFNDFLKCNPHEFTDFQMWHYDEGGDRSPNYPPTPIPAHLVRPNIFIFLGRLQTPDQIDYELILDDFDRLLSLYHFVEGTDDYPPTVQPKGKFQFKPGCTVKAGSTNASVAEKQLDVNLRHNQIQQALHKHLVSVYGSPVVGTEIPSGTGGKIDVVVYHGGEFWFYEIKTAMSAEACILDGIAQILEYSYWPGAQEAEQLIIVGEPPLDEKSHAFVALLRKRFSLPLRYQQFDVNKGKLLDSEK